MPRLIQRTATEWQVVSGKLRMELTPLTSSGKVGTMISGNQGYSLGAYHG